MTYPTYPYGAPYGAPYGPPWGPPPPPAPPATEPPLRPLATAPRGVAPDWHARIVGMVFVVLTAAAVVLALVAPLLVNHSAGVVPAGWASVFDGQPNSELWQTLAGCDTTSRGLHVTGSDTAVGCKFAPSVSRDLTSQGFYLEAVTAPPADLTGAEDPVIAFGLQSNVLAVGFNQLGEYTICTNPCDFSASVYDVGATIAWHTNGYTANTIAVLYSPDSSQVTVYANGQEVTTVAFAVPASSRLLLTTDSVGEALYTHVTIYSGSGAA